MTDYDLGKARGRIVLDVDERGFRKAEGANDRLAKSTHRVAEGFVDASKAQQDYDKQVRRTEQSEESLRRKQSEVQKTLNKLNEAQSLVNRLKDEGRTKTERYKQAVDNAQKAQNRYTEAVSEASRAESKLNDEINKVNDSFRRLQNALASDQSLSQTTKQIKGLNDELGKTNRSKTKVDIDSDSALYKLRQLRKEHQIFLKQLSRTASVAGAAGKVGGFASGGLVLGGLAGLAGGGLTGFGVNGIMATVQALGQLSGLAGLLPVVFGNLATSIGTTVIAFQGMGDAMDAIASNDAEKFGEALKKLSTNGQEFALALNQMYPALEEFQKAVQDNFFKGLANEIKQLSETYMPLLQNSFQGFANIINGTIRDLAEWAKQNYVIEDFKTIMDNLSTTMGTLAPTARMLADIFLDIMKVSSDFGPSLAGSFQIMVKEFRDFIDAARADGSLAQWIQTGIDSFKSLMNSLKMFGQAFGNVFKIQNQYSGGFFGFIERISAAFLEWTKSTEGNAALNNFFRSITELSKTLTPVLGSLANIILGQIIPMFADLGTKLQPGILAFLKGFSDALTILSPYIQQLQGPLNQLLTALGESLVQVVQTLGPQLPAMFQAFTDAILQILPHLPEIAKGIVDMSTAFIQYGPGIIENLMKLLPLLIKLAWIVSDLSVLFISGASSLLAGIVNIGKGIGDFLTNLLMVWPQQAGDAVREFVTSMDISADIEIVKGWFSEFFTALGIAVTEGWSALLKTLDGMKDKLWDWLKELPGKAIDAGKAIVDGLIEGMTSKLGPVGRAIKSVVDEVSDWLPHSPAKKGPFSGQGYTLVRGEKLATDFAAGINAGSNEAQYAGGNLSKATEVGMQQFVKDMLQFSSFGQRMTGLFQNIADQMFNIFKIATTNPITGESFLPKPKSHWQVTATPDEIRRIKEDKAFQDKLDAERKAQRDAAKEKPKLRPDNVSPSPAGAELATKVPKLDANSTRRDIVAAIAGSAQQRGFSPEEVKAIVATAIQESGLDPSIMDPSGQWKGLFQQDKSYPNRNDPNAQISEFLKRLQELRASGGSSGNIWKDIFWLQQAPGASSANDAFANGRQSYLDEIMSRQAEASKVLADVTANPQRPTQAQNMRGIVGSGNFPKVRPGDLSGINLSTVQVAAQKYANDCIDASARIILSASGINMSEDQLMNIITPGGSISSLAAGLNQINPKGRYVAMEGSGGSPEAMLKAITKSIDKGIGAILNVAPGSSIAGKTFAPGHFIAITGYDPNTGRINLSDTADGRTYSVTPQDAYQASRGRGIVAGTGMGMQKPQMFGPQAPVPAPPPTPVGPQYSDNRRVNQMIDPNVHGMNVVPPGPTNRPSNEILQMNDNLDEIAAATKEQLSQQDIMINELRAQSPMLDAAIKAAQDPNASDTNVGNALDQISQIAQDQRTIDTAQSRYIADGLDSLASTIAGQRGMTQVQGMDPVQTAQQVVSGAFGIIGDGFKVFDSAMKSIGSAANIADTLVRGIENTNDIMNIVDELQSFIELAANISQTVSDGLALAGMIAMAAGGGQDGGATGAILQAISSVFGVVTSIYQTWNAAIDLVQEGYDIATKYLGKALSYVVGGGNGSLMGDIKFLLDANTNELKTWSGDNPNDKRSFASPNTLQFTDKPGDAQAGRIRDLNLYVGPGTDPNEAMNAAMWSIKTDSHGVFTGSY